MANFNRVDKVIDLLKEVDTEFENNPTHIDTTTESANHFLLRHIAINTAIIADYIDREYFKKGADDK